MIHQSLAQSLSNRIVHRPGKVPAALMGGSDVPWKSLRLTSPASGALLSEWWFDEGAGTTVADQVGSSPINLELPTTPNYSWQSSGIRTTSGLVQTPTINSSRTVVCLIKVPKDNATGFTLSGGVSSGSGIIGNTGSGALIHTGFSRGVVPLWGRVGTSSGTGTGVGAAAYRLNRGGWYLLFSETGPFNSPWGFGGRHSTTTNRVPTFDIAWAAVYSGVLTDSERLQIYNMARGLSKERGFFIDYRDCPTQVNTVGLLGQSNAEGRAKITELTSPYQARTSPAGCFISRRNTLTTAALVMGSTQQTDAPTTDFGPEMGMAWKSEDNGKGLYISKYAIGGTFLGATAAIDWNISEDAVSAYFNNALRNLWTMEADMLNAGVGPNLRGIAWMQGENDATLEATGSAYESNLTALIATTRQQVGDSAAKFALARIRNQDPSFNPAALANVRAAYAAIASADANVDWFDTDSFSLRADNVHYNGAGMKLLGEAFYDSLLAN